MVTWDLLPDSVSHTQIFILQRNAQNFLSSFINKLYDVRLTTRELFDFQFEAQCKLFSKMNVLNMFPFHRDIQPVCNRVNPGRNRPLHWNISIRECFASHFHGLLSGYNSAENIFYVSPSEISGICSFLHSSLSLSSVLFSSASLATRTLWTIEEVFFFPYFW